MSKFCYSAKISLTLHAKVCENGRSSESPNDHGSGEHGDFHLDRSRGETLFYANVYISIFTSISQKLSIIFGHLRIIQYICTCQTIYELTEENDITIITYEKDNS